MFDIAWGEFVVIAVVALIVIGPKELPAVLRAIGQWTTKIRRMAAEFQGQFQEALREAEMADLKKEVDNLNDTARGFTSQFDDPLNLNQATKWEPKPDDGNQVPVTEPVDMPPEPALADAAAGAAPVPAGEHGAAPAVPEAAPPPAAPSTAQPPEGSGQKGGEGAVHP